MPRLRKPHKPFIPVGARKRKGTPTIIALDPGVLYKDKAAKKVHAKLDEFMEGKNFNGKILYSCVAWGTEGPPLIYHRIEKALERRKNGKPGITTVRTDSSYDYIASHVLRKMKPWEKVRVEGQKVGLNKQEYQYYLHLAGLDPKRADRWMETLQHAGKDDIILMHPNHAMHLTREFGVDIGKVLWFHPFRVHKHDKRGLRADKQDIFHQVNRLNDRLLEPYVRKPKRKNPKN